MAKTGDKRITKRVYQSPNGRWRVYIYVNGKLRPFRLPASMTLKEVKDWRAAREVDLKREVEAEPDETKPEAVPGTFEADVNRTYLKAVQAMPTIKERTRHMGLWVERFGHLRRQDVTPVMIRTVRDEWLTAGPKLVQKSGTKCGHPEFIEVAEPLSAQEVTLRLRALENFYTVMNGRHGHNPVREVPEPASDETPPRAVPHEVIDAILGNLRPGTPTLARLRIMRYAGLSQKQIALTQKGDVNFGAGTLFLRKRHKGKAEKKQGETDLPGDFRTS